MSMTSRRAFTLADAPEEDIENLLEGFQQILDEADGDAEDEDRTIENE